MALTDLHPLIHDSSGRPTVGLNTYQEAGQSERAGEWQNEGKGNPASGEAEPEWRFARWRGRGG
jgi:hypothetical protein